MIDDGFVFQHNEYYMFRDCEPCPTPLAPYFDRERNGLTVPLRYSSCRFGGILDGVSFCGSVGLGWASVNAVQWGFLPQHKFRVRQHHCQLLPRTVTPSPTAGREEPRKSAALGECGACPSLSARLPLPSPVAGCLDSHYPGPRQ